MPPNPENSRLVSISLRRRLMPVPGLLTRPAPCILVYQVSPVAIPERHGLFRPGKVTLGSPLGSRMIMVRPLARRNKLIPLGSGGIPEPFPLSFSVHWQGMPYERRDLGLQPPAGVVLVALGWPARLGSGLGKDCITSPQDPGVERWAGPACLWGCSIPGYGTTTVTSRSLCPSGSVRQRRRVCASGARGGGESCPGQANQVAARAQRCRAKVVLVAR